MLNPVAPHSPIPPIPAFINPESGSGGQDGGGAARTDELIERDGRFDVRLTRPDRLTDAVREAMRNGAQRVLVAGGDGSIASAAAALVGSGVELAILPLGTLNHFARDHKLPQSVPEALDLAAEGRAAPVDVAYVNEQIFINTSSVGAYVRFVKRRESLERRIGYRLASVLASLHVFAAPHRFRLELDVEGRRHFYRTTLAFIGVGERELRIPILGGRVEGGRSGLHVMVPHASSRARLLIVAATSIARGVQGAVGDLAIDSFVVDSCRIDLRYSRDDIAVDGEILPAKTPLYYRLERDALRVVVDL
ncbi:MAG TPA: diacylglycerol kinase family protein [Gemmatimonadaceae bacterium]|nr:diacylglycerol kinase family protein [Gemmatimonadaceae bacterium]